MWSWQLYWHAFIAGARQFVLRCGQWLCRWVNWVMPYLWLYCSCSTKSKPVDLLSLLQFQWCCLLVNLLSWVYAYSRFHGHGNQVLCWTYCALNVPPAGSNWFRIYLTFSILVTWCDSSRFFFCKRNFQKILGLRSIKLWIVPPRTHSWNSVESKHCLIRSLLLMWYAAESYTSLEFHALRSVSISNDLYGNDFMSSVERKKGFTKTIGRTNITPISHDIRKRQCTSMQKECLLLFEI